MLDWWEQRSQREKLILQIGFVVVICFCLYYFVVKPWQNKITNLQKQVQQKQELLTWMRPTIDKIKHLKRKYPVEQAPVEDLLASVEQSMHSFNLKPKTLEQAKQNTVRIVFDDIGFNKFIKWLINFQEKYAIQVEQAKLSASNKEGIIKVSLTLSSLN